MMMIHEINRAQCTEFRSKLYEQVNADLISGW
jgi:hypothetical protein